MGEGTQSHAEAGAEELSSEEPRITVCESCPGKSVFLEAGNTDGWIATDVTVDVVR